VVAWSEIGSDPSAAVSLLRAGSSGYPLNAALAASIRVIIVSAFDAEAYLAVIALASVE
jgi:hypothetical protein